MAHGKLAFAVEYDHYVAIDWSVKTMPLAHMSRRDQITRVFERPTELKEIKTYLGWSEKCITPLRRSSCS